MLTLAVSTPSCSNFVAIKLEPFSIERIQNNPVTAIPFNSFMTKLKPRIILLMIPLRIFSVHIIQHQYFVVFFFSFVQVIVVKLLLFIKNYPCSQIKFARNTQISATQWLQYDQKERLEQDQALVQLDIEIEVVWQFSYADCTRQELRPVRYRPSKLEMRFQR